MSEAPRIYFAGVAQHFWCSQFAGHRVLESFADVQPLMDRYRPTFKSMCLDSGAYTEMTTGEPIDLGAFIDFCQAHGKAYDFIAALDSITGGVEVNIKNWDAMRTRGVEAMPTFHQGEPFSILEDYGHDVKRIGLGFQRPIKNAREWLDECFALIPDTVLVHGWAMTSFTDYPFHSVDSRTWFHELRGLMAVEGQGADAMRCLTQPEMLDIIIKKYLRLPKRERWGMSSKADDGQLSLLEASR
jgi:hypothetical protein